MNPAITLTGIGLIIYAVLSLGSMATMSVGAGLLFVLWMIDQMRSGNSQKADFFSNQLASIGFCKPPVRTYIFVSGAVVLSCALSLIFAKIYPLSFNGRFSEVHFLSDCGKLWYFIWPLFLLLALRKIPDKTRLQVLRAWILTFIVLSVVGIFQHFTGWPRPQGIPGVPGRFHATLFLGHHLSVASVFIFPFFVILDLIKNAKTGNRLLPLSLLIFGSIVGFATLMLTYSRTLWIGLPCGIILWLLLNLNKKLRIAALLSVLVIGGIITQIPSINERLHQHIGIAAREDLWEANIKFFEARPITGVGLKHNQELSGDYLMEKYHSTDVFSGHAHNNVLDFLGGTGLLGLLAFIAWSIFVLKWSIRPGVQVAGLSLSTGFFCAWVVFQINGLTQVNFWEGKVQHQMMWCVAWILLGSLQTLKEREG